MAVIELAGKKLTSGKADQVPYDVNWLLSLGTYYTSEVVTGEYAGKSLADYVAARGIGCLGTKAEELNAFPFSIKRISNAIEGVVQVNANKDQDSMWYIQNAKEGAKIYLGFAKPLTQQEVAEGMQNNTLIQSMDEMPVKTGDVLEVKAGAVYSIGSGIDLIDIQNEGEDLPEGQNILEVLTLEPVNHGSGAGEWLTSGSAQWSCMGKVGSFDADEYQLNGRMDMDADGESCKVLVFVDGGAVIEWDDQILHAETNTSFFVEAGTEPFHITGNARFLVVTLA